MDESNDPFVFPLVEDGTAAVSIVVPPDRSLDGVALCLVDVIKTRFGVTPGVIDAQPATQNLPTRHAILLGCLADNPYLARLYLRWNCLVDRWVPGAGGHVLQTIRSPLRPGEHVLLVGGSDAEGVRRAAETAADQIRHAPDHGIPWQLQVQLGDDHLPLPADRLDVLGTSVSKVSTAASTLPTQPYRSGYAGGSVRNHLLRLGMYGPHADNFHFSRSSQLGLRYLYTGHAADAQAYRKTLLSEVRSGVVSGLYHYKSLRMFQLWSLLEPAPLFSDPEREEITAALHDYLQEESGIAQIEMIRSASIRTQILNRHHACEALNLWVGTDWLWRRTGESHWLDLRAIADTYFEAQDGTDVPLTGLTEGYASYLEVYLEWMLLRCPERIAEDAHVRRWAERVMGLCTNTGQLVTGPQTDETRFPYHLLHKLTFLLQDGRFSYVADLRERQVLAGMDRVLQFSAGQAFAGDTETCEPTDAVGLTVFPANERLRIWQAPSVPGEAAFDRITGRSGWTPDDDYVLIIGMRSGGKSLPNVGAVAAYERLGCRLITSDAVPLFPHSASAWRHSVATVNIDGRGLGLAEGAQLRGQREIAGGYALSFDVLHPEVTWTRHLFWKPTAYLLVVDSVIVDNGETDSEASACVNWRCAGSLLDLEGGTATFDLGDTEGRFHVQAVGQPATPVHVSCETNHYPVLASPPGTPPNRETMLHASTTMADGRAMAATLLHATPSATGPPFRLIAHGDGWDLIGEETVLDVRPGDGGRSLGIQRKAKASPVPTTDPAIAEQMPGIGVSTARSQAQIPWSIDLPGTPTAVARSDEGRVAVGTDAGHLVVVDPDGQVCLNPASDDVVTALSFTGANLITGTRTGRICRLNDTGDVAWQANCQFRPERTFWPYWFLETPVAGALTPGIGAGDNVLAVGTGSTSLNFLDLHTGALLDDVLSPYGMPDRVVPYESAAGESLFLVGHSFLTCGSTVRAWSATPSPREIRQYRDSLQPAGRSVDGWDSCGVVDIWAGALSADADDVVIVVRHGAVSQITAYDAASTTPLWDVLLGGSPVALAVVPGDAASSARCHVADEFGWLVSIDGDGSVVHALQIAPSLQGLRPSPAGLMIWSDCDLFLFLDGQVDHLFEFEGDPVTWWTSQASTGLLCHGQERLHLCLRNL